jgi:hypothetical protein
MLKASCEFFSILLVATGFELHGVSEEAKRERTRYYLPAELWRIGEVMGDAGFERVDREQREGERGYFLAGPLA